MSHHLVVIIAVVLLVLIYGFFLVMWAYRYIKVGPNQVLVVSGRKYHLPDGTVAGWRCVKGGGAFVWPVFEKADVLSLEVLTLEMPRTKARTAQGSAVEADCIAQFKIKGDDASLVVALESFLSKSADDMKNLVRPLLEKHLRVALGGLSLEELKRDWDACAGRVQADASEELGKMGLGVVSFTIRDVRAA